MANRKKLYTLPTGADTDNIDEYIREWRALATPIEDSLNLRLVACNPTLTFECGNPHVPGDVKSVNLPVWFVTALNAVLEKQSDSIPN